MMCFMIYWGAKGTPLLWIPVAVVLPAVLGFVQGSGMGAKMCRELLGESHHYAARRFPGGIWFVVAATVLITFGGCVVIEEFGRDTGLLIIHVNALVAGTYFCAKFATVGVMILRLERQERKQVWMLADGFHLSDS